MSSDSPPSHEPSTSDTLRRRGVNLGNTLDTLDGPPRPVTAALVDTAYRAGFNTVRLPVRWSAHADHRPPFTLDAHFAALVDQALDLVEGRGLRAIVNVHHYTELMANPDAHAERFVGLWQQISTRYAARPSSVAFELLNEPNQAMDASRWNQLLQPTWAAVRDSNPGREIIIGTAPMNDAAALDQLGLPRDPDVTATVHYYEPMSFTHQGADWVHGQVPPLGARWGTGEDHKKVTNDLDRVHTWSVEHGVKVLVGEFGSYDRAPLQDRTAWTSHVCRELDRLQLEWCYWDLTGDFGVYHPQTGTMRTSLLQALLPDPANHA